MRTAVPDIFDEVEQDLRAEQMRNLFKRYGGLMIAVLIMVIAGTAAWEAWKWYDGRRIAHTAEQYFAAVKVAEGHPGPGRQEAVPMFAAIAKDGASEAYRTLARLREAGLLAEAGDAKGASALWTRVRDDRSADRLLRDVAGLQWAQHQIGTGNPAEVAASLRPLASPDNPFHGLAQEAQALLELQQGHTDAARDTLKQLSQDGTVPEGVRQRATSLLAQLGQPPSGPVPKPQARAGAS